MPTRRFGLGVRLAFPSTALTQPKQAYISLVDFLSVAQQQNVYFMPVGPQASLGALGKGISGLVTQSTADAMTSFAFKRFIPSDFENEGSVDHVFSSLITEILIMQHEPIRRNPHIADLIGVCWDIDNSSKKVWPVIVTHKANCGDLENFLFENGDLAPELRFQICANIAEATELLHECGVAHGDLKPENVLIQRSEDGIIRSKIIDFGASAFGNQMRQPVLSNPWNAPESVTTQEVPVSAMILSDLYSFGLLCAQILLPRDILADAKLLFMPQGRKRAEWAETLESVEILQRSDSLATALMSLVDRSVLPTPQQRLLRALIPQVVCNDPSRRSLNWKELKEIFAKNNSFFSTAVSSEPYASPLCIKSIRPESCNHNVLDVTTQLGEFDDIDYLFRMNVTKDMLSKIPSLTCDECLKRITFQVALSYLIGFGVSRAKDQSDYWLHRSGMKKEDMDEAISLLQQEYRPTGRLADQVRNAIGLDALVTLDRAEQYQIEGRLLEAGEILSNEISGREHELGENHISTANLKSELAQIHRIQGRLSEANALQQEVVAVRCQTLAKGHPSIVTSISALARIVREQGRFRDAEELQLGVLNAFEKQLGKTHPDTLTAQSNLGITLLLQGCNRDAEAMFRSTFESRTETMTAEHPLTIRAAISLFLCLRNQGKLQEAERLMLDIKDRCTRLARDDFVAQGILQLNIAILHSNQNRFHEAESIAIKVVGSFEETLGEHDLTTIQAREVLVDICNDKGQPEEAEKHLNKCLDGTKPLGERNSTFLKFKTMLAENLLTQDLFSESISQAQEVLTMYQGSMAKDPDNVLACTEFLARGYAAIGQRGEAENTRSQLLLLCKKELGDKHPLTMRARSAFAQSYVDQELWGEAEPLEKEVYLWSIEQLGHGKIAVTSCLNLALIYREQGRFSDCEELAERAISWSEECYGASHVETKAAVTFLFGLHVRAGSLDKAESLYQLKLSSDCDDNTNDRLMVEVISSLADLRLAQGEPKAAQELLQEAMRLSKMTLRWSDADAVTLASRLFAAKMREELTDEVEVEALRLIRLKEQMFGEKHATTLMTISDLAYIYALNNRLEDAGKLFGKLEDLVDRNTVQNQVNFANICFKRAEFYFRTRQFHKAKKEEETCLRIRQDTLGDEHRLTLVCMASLSSTLTTLEMYDEAERYMRLVLDIRLRILPVNHISTLGSKKDLAGILFYQNRLEESEDLYAEVVDASLQVLGDCSFTRDQIESLSIVRTRRRCL